MGILRENYRVKINLLLLLLLVVLSQGAQALICISVVCFSVYLFYECLYIAF